MGRQTQTPAPDGLACNEVRLIGRLSRTPQGRELPSGDALVAFVLVVDRPGARATKVRTQTHDSIDCVAWGAGARRRALALEPGDLVEVSGALRRRFYSAGPAKASRYEVEAVMVRRLRRTA